MDRAAELQREGGQFGIGREVGPRSDALQQAKGQANVLGARGEKAGLRRLRPTSP